MVEPRFVDLNGRSTVVVAREYPHPVDRVWRAVTSPEHLGQWFPSAVEVDLRPGGAMRFPAFAGTDAATGTVEAVDPPTRLAFTWGTDRMTFDLAPAADGSATTFTLTHSFDDRYGAASFAAGWEQCLVGLRSVLADEPMPGGWDRGVDRHEQLVGEFGLDEPVVADDAGRDRWTVRWERQLTCPAEVAWDLWFGTDVETGEQRDAPAVGEGLAPYLAPGTVIGIVTEVERHRVLAFDVTPEGGPGDHVRWELREGTGHGARMSLTVNGSGAADRAAAIELWGAGAVRHLAERAAGWARQQVPA